MKASHRLSAALNYAKARKRQLDCLLEDPSESTSLRKPCVYLLECDGFVKIGYGDDPWKRISDCQVGNPHEILLLGIIPTWDPASLEAELHKEFGAYRVRGEWFRIPEEKLNPLIHKAFEAFAGKNSAH